MREPPGSWLLLEYDSDYQVAHISIYHVCRRSRAVTLAEYDVLSPENRVLFHRDLDTLEALGHSTITSDAPVKMDVLPVPPELVIIGDSSLFTVTFLVV